MKQIAVFASGTGTNFEAIYQAIQQGQLACEIALVVTDNPTAAVIEKARKHNLEVFAFSAKEYSCKDEYEKEIVRRCQEKNVDLLVLAGYMRLLASTMLNSYPQKIVNIHPSLLPAFKGKDAIGQAIEYGVKIMGVTIHYVDATMDGGKILAQRGFEVQPQWTKEEIEQHVHEIEHQLYPETLKYLLKENEL